MFQEDQGAPACKLQYPLDSNSYQILDQIGDSFNTIVYKALCKPLNSLVVIKSIILPESGPSFSRETNTLDLSHPNLLSPHCSFIVDNRIWIIMPFVPAGSLQSIIISKSFPDGLSEPCIAIILKQTLQALDFLHALGHAHRDIKPSNILIDNYGLVKLADFGSSSSNFEASISPSSEPGSPYWIAPEILSNVNDYSFKVDIWAFGITALELVHGRPPISHLPPSKSLLLKIIRRFHSWNHEKNKNKFSKDFKNMVSLCLDQDPSKRPSVKKLLDHDFFKNCTIEPDFLTSKLLGLDGVEERFKESRTQRFPPMDDLLIRDEKGNDKWIGNNIRGWRFNKDRFQLDPVVDNAGRVEADEAHMSEEAHGLRLAEEYYKHVMVRGLQVMVLSLNEQKRQVMDWIGLLGGDQKGGNGS